MCCPLITIHFNFRWHYCYYCSFRALLNCLQYEAIPNPQPHQNRQGLWPAVLHCNFATLTRLCSQTLSLCQNRQGPWPAVLYCNFTTLTRLHSQSPLPE